MAWLAVDKDGTEAFYAKKPLRELEMWVERPLNSNRVNHTENLPHGTIFRLIGRELDWESEPVELTEETLQQTADGTVGALEIAMNQLDHSIPHYKRELEKAQSRIAELEKLVKPIKVTEREVLEESLKHIQGYGLNSSEIYVKGFEDCFKWMRERMSK